MLTPELKPLEPLEPLEPNQDVRMRRIYSAVIVIEALIIFALWAFGRYFAG